MASSIDPDYQEDLRPSSSQRSADAGGCCIHCTDASGQLIDLKQESTWETLKRAAKIRCCHEILDQEVNNQTGLPTISYHRKCYQVFTMKSSLDKIQNALENKFKTAFETTDDSRPKREISKQGAILLPKECIFCRKNKYKSKVLEKLVKCVDQRAANSIFEASKNSDNFYVKGLADQDLIAKEAYYHLTCYKLFTKPQKDPTCNAYTEAERFAFKEVLRKCHELSLIPKITLFSKLVDIMKDVMLSENVMMGESTRKFLKRNLEKQSDIKMFNCRGKAVVYPSSLHIEKVIEQNLELEEENETFKSHALQDSAAVVLCGKVIKTEVSNLRIRYHGHHKLKIYTQKNSKSQNP